LTSDERILGSSSFVEKTLANAGEDYDQRMRLKASGIDLDVVMGVAASHIGVNKAELCSTIKQQRNDIPLASPLRSNPSKDSLNAGGIE